MKITVDDLFDDIKLLCQVNDTHVYDDELKMRIKGKMSLVNMQGLRTPNTDELDFIDVYKLIIEYAIRIDFDMGNPELLKELYFSTFSTAKTFYYNEYNAVEVIL